MVFIDRKKGKKLVAYPHYREARDFFRKVALDQKKRKPAGFLENVKSREISQLFRMMWKLLEWDYQNIDRKDNFNFRSTYETSKYYQIAESVRNDYTHMYSNEGYMKCFLCNLLISLSNNYVGYYYSNPKGIEGRSIVSFNTEKEKNRRNIIIERKKEMLAILQQYLHKYGRNTLSKRRFLVYVKEYENYK